MSERRVVWQISGGPAMRSFADVFLRHGVALIGPGDIGPWRADREADDFEAGVVRRFATEVCVGDAVLLRTGASRIVAVGAVADDYQYLPTFDDVNGWDLQHARRVRWCRLPAEFDFGSGVFGGSPVRFSRVTAETVTDYVERFLNSPPTDWQSGPLPSLPVEEPGLASVPEYLRELVAAACDLEPLWWDGERFGERPREDEMVAHFVVPLLRALGWPLERIAVKWRNVDVAVFRELPRTPEHCHFIIEAKRLGAGVEGALHQAKDYLSALRVERDIVVTDGVRYRLYDCRREFAPVAYANLIRLKQSAVGLFNRMKRP